MIAFLFGCYSAGTPQDDNFPTPPMRNPRRRAPAPFVSALAQGLLGHPDGGALAVLGHIDQTWTRTFGTGEGKGCWHIESFLKQLLDGNPVGHAMDWMNERFAEMSAELTDVLDERREILPGETVDARWLSGLWRANNDARNFVLLGDPAVRLAALPAVPDASQKHAPAVSLRESLSSIIQRGAAIRPSRTPAEILSRDADPDLAR